MFWYWLIGISVFIVFIKYRISYVNKYIKERQQQLEYAKCLQNATRRKLSVRTNIPRYNTDPMSIYKPEYYENEEQLDNIQW